MSDGPNSPRAKRQDKNATLLGSVNHGWRVRRILDEAEDHDIRLDSGQVKNDLSARGKSACNQAGVGVVFGQSLDVAIESMEPGCREDPDLPHGTPKHPAVSNTALNDSA